MKTGIIVYVAGESSWRENVQLDHVTNDPRLQADRIAVASDLEEIVDQWFTLTVKGVQMIKCLIAEAGERNELRLTGRELRLCG